MQYDSNEVMNVDLQVKFDLARLFVSLDAAELDGNLNAQYNLLNIIYKRLKPLMIMKKFDTAEIEVAIKSIDQRYVSDMNGFNPEFYSDVKQNINLWGIKLHEFCIKMDFWLKTRKGYKESMGFSRDTPMQVGEDQDDSG